MSHMLPNPDPRPVLDRAPRTEQILGAATHGIVAIDVDERISFANPAAAAMLRSGSVDDLVGEPVRSYIPFLNWNSADTVDARVLDTGQLCLRRDGTSFPVEFETGAMIDNGQVVGMVVSFRDISRRRAVDQARDELLATATHELRSPLTSIRGALGLLASSQPAMDPALGQRMLDIALSNIDRLIRLVNNTLDLERLESGETPRSIEMCDVGQLMTQASDAVCSLADQSAILLDVRTIEAQVPGDPDQLVQVLINLLSNAIKFSPSNGGIVWLDAEQSSDEILFRVRDHGRGIPADMLESIFNRFAQVQADDSRDKRGSGLGLAISRSIVDRHGGHIWAESAPGAGTTIFVALPRLFS
jgi:two-component system sensor histidine kinase VicK